MHTSQKWLRWQRTEHETNISMTFVWGYNESLHAFFDILIEISKFKLLRLKFPPRSDKDHTTRLYLVQIRDGSVGPVSRYRQHF